MLRVQRDGPVVLREPNYRHLLMDTAVIPPHES